MTIGEVSAQSGVAASAIRFYESAGLLPRPPRTGGRRQYAISILDRLALLDRARACGFSLGEIRRLLHGFRADTPPSDRWQALARRKLAELDELQAKIESMRALLRRSCACRDLEECGRRYRARGSSRQV